MDHGDVDVAARRDVDHLKGNAVGLWAILFLCVTGSAPLAVFIYNTPYTMPFGSGKGGPGAFLFATIVLTFFSIAYAQMAKKVRAAGGMFTYVSHGLGQAWGMMAGYSLMVGYVIFGVALLGGFSSFAQAKWLQYSDTQVNWLWFALVGVALVVCLAYFDVEISAKVLGVALISEIVIIGISSIFLFAHARDVSVAPVLPWNGLTEGVAPGIGVFFAFWSWVGFEAAPNYAEEAKDPVKTIPVALVFSCVSVGVLYTIMSWALVSAYGTNFDWSKVGAANGTAVIDGKTVAVSDSSQFVLGPVAAAAGEFWRDALSWLIITGSIACAAALTNAGLRYIYAMGREGLLPRYLGRTHPIHKSPYTAVLTWGAIAVVLFLAFRVTSHTGLDAYYWLSPQGVIWIVLVQALTALSVYAYFRREHPDELSWKTNVCAWLGFAGQIAVLALFYHYETSVTGTGSLYVKELFTIGSGTWSVPVSWLGIIGALVPVATLGYAYWLRAQDPVRYGVAGRFVNEAAFAETS
jgi:amino acid transporter